MHSFRIMGLYYFVITFCCFICLTFAKDNGIFFDSVKCLSVKTVTLNVTSVSLLQCASLCRIDKKKAFTFNSQTGECRVVIEDIDVSPTCEMPSDVQYFKMNSACSSLPVPSGYTLEHPFYGSSALARYRCVAFSDQPPVDSCPVVKCDGPHNFTASCSVKDVFNSSLPEYEGGVTCTVRGVTCQRWDSNYPHDSNFYVGRSDLRNRCQLESELRPWCYTTDPELRWDFCPVEDMDCGDPPTISIPVTMTGIEIEIKWPYQEFPALAWYRCASYKTDDPVPNCPVTRCGGDRMWSNATISCSEKDCYNVTSESYQGQVSCTDMGYTCQRWDSDYPNTHTILAGRSDLHNWCQMAGESRPWCYTILPTVRWEFCAVKECP